MVRRQRLRLWQSSLRRSRLHPRQRCPRCRGPHDRHATTLEPRRGSEPAEPGGKTAWEQERERDRERASKAAERARRAAELTAELAVQSERAVSEVCTHPPGLPRDEPTAERSVAPTAGDRPFLAGGDSLLSERSSLAPRPRGARARSIARDVDAKSLVDVVVDFNVKATGKDGVQMRQ